MLISDEEIEAVLLRMAKQKTKPPDLCRWAIRAAIEI